MCYHDRPPPLYESFTAPSTRKTSEAPGSPPKEVNIPPPTVVAPVKLAAPMQPGLKKMSSDKKISSLEFSDFDFMQVLKCKPQQSLAWKEFKRLPARLQWRGSCRTRY